jgi:hypothetical protein
MKRGSPNGPRLASFAFFECACLEHVAVAGRQSVEQGAHGDPEDPEFEYYDYYEALFFEPPLHLISLESRVPNDVREELIASFRVFWSDPEACASRLRIGIEKLLDYVGVKRFVISKERKRVELKLHSRIELFARSGRRLSDHLMAVKWLGNAGSHRGVAVPCDDTLDAYELIEAVLREMFDPSPARVAKIAKTINKTKKPRSASRKWLRIGSRRR